MAMADGKEGIMASELELPLVSAVIPTRNRPELVCRAIRSALTQTYPNLEVIVVVDGPDSATLTALGAFRGSKVQVVDLDQNVGLSEARNRGFRRSRGAWIAFLDDDDEWLPRKIEMQVALAESIGGGHQFVVHRFVERLGSGDRIMPRILPTSPEKFSEYIYCQKGFLQPSTFFMDRELLEEVPFTTGLRHIEDSDWMLRAMQTTGVRVAAVPEVLSIYNNIPTGNRESETTPWLYAYNWALRNRSLFSARAFPYYMALLCTSARAQHSSISVFFRLFRAARTQGSLEFQSALRFFASCFIPRPLLKSLAAKLG